MLVYMCFHVFAPFSAHFYPPLHHNGKGSIELEGTHCYSNLTPVMHGHYRDGS